MQRRFKKEKKRYRKNVNQVNISLHGKATIYHFINKTLFKKQNEKNHQKTQCSKQHILLLGYQNPPCKQSTGQVY